MAALVSEETAREVIERFKRGTGTTMRLQQRRLGLKSKGPLRRAMVKVLGSEEAYGQLLAETCSNPKPPVVKTARGEQRHRRGSGHELSNRAWYAAAGLPG